MTDEQRKRRWKPIDGYPGYFVSDLGDVKNPTGKTLKQFATRKGYLRVSLYANKTCRQQTVASIVLTTFRGERPYKNHAAHLNGNKTDNRLINLSWVTQKENEAHKYLHGTKLIGEKSNGRKLCVADVLEIRRSKLGSNELSKKYRVSMTNIRYIVRRITWTHI